MGVCRQSGQPFTNIETDGWWKASVHLEYNMPLCWLIQPIIRRNKLNLSDRRMAWWRWQSLTGKAQPGTPVAQTLEL